MSHSTDQALRAAPASALLSMDCVKPRGEAYRVPSGATRHAISAVPIVVPGCISRTQMPGMTSFGP
jgi:hypothetical protein